jgi:hypothetical protein
MRYEYVDLPHEFAAYQLVGRAAPAAEASAEEPIAKTDPQVAFVGATPEGEFTFALPAYDLQRSNRINAIHVVLVPEGSGFPDSAEDAVDPSKTPYPAFKTDASALQAGGQLVVDVSAAPAAVYGALAIVEFES